MTTGSGLLQPQQLLYYNAFICVIILYYFVEVPFLLFFRLEGTSETM